MTPLDFVCFSINYWEKRWDRKHHFMVSLSRKDSVGQVVYVEPSLNLIRLFLFPFSELATSEQRHRWWRALTFQVEKVYENFYVYSPLLFLPLWRFYPVYKLNRWISLVFLRLRLGRLRIRKPVIWTYHPYDECVLDHWKDRTASCFDWAELWSEWFMELSEKRRQVVARMEAQVIRKSDVVFVVSQELLRRAKQYNPNSYFLASGAPMELFRDLDKMAVPEDLRDIPRPIIGYVGTIGERLDVPLLLKISEHFPGVSLVLIGRALSDRMDERDLGELRERENVYFLGEREYALLPAYMYAFDVGIIPYIPERIMLNEPTKHYDYLAAGKPVVSMAIVELLRFGEYIEIARSHEEFLDRVRACLEEEPVGAVRKRIEFMERNSWSVRADEILERLAEVMGCAEGGEGR